MLPARSSTPTVATSSPLPSPSNGLRATSPSSHSAVRLISAPPSSPATKAPSALSVTARFCATLRKSRADTPPTMFPVSGSSERETLNPSSIPARSTLPPSAARLRVIPAAAASASAPTIST